MTTTSSYFHVRGYVHNTGGYFEGRFNSEREALEFWGADSDWREGEVVEEIFEPTKRSYRVIRRVGF